MRLRRGGGHPRRAWLAAGLGCVLVVSAGASRAAGSPSPGYRDYQAFTAELDRAVANAGAAARKISLGRTRGGRDIWAVALGRDAHRLVPHPPQVAELHDDGATGPGLLLVGGTDALQIAGSEEALGIFERLALDNGRVDSVTRMLSRVTLYVVPRVSPDACERYFEKPAAEITTNRTPTDDDHDGQMDEDGPDDLNGDGVITTMRVEDPEGEWMVNPDEPRLLRLADRAKGEQGRYKVYTEGLDNDHDDRWNEDGPGGVDFSRNWPIGYKYFSEGAGSDPMSEIESRSMGDFLFDHANIAAVMVLGAQDNLLHPWKADPGNSRAIQRALAAAARERGGDFGGGYGGNTDGTRPGATGRGGGGGGGGDLDPRISSPPPEDAAVYEQFSERYRKLTGLKDSPDPPPAEGDLASFVYYGYGRWALTARPWWPAAPQDTAAVRADSASSGALRGEGDGARGARAGGDGDAPRGLRGGGENPRGGRGRGASGGSRGGAGGDAEPNADAMTLKALDALHIPAMVPWTAVADPDFPGRKVEVGGFRPFVRTVPPAAELDSLAARGARFAADLLSRLPVVHLRLEPVTHLGPGLARVEALVTNEGTLPLRAQMGRIARWPGSPFVELKLPPGAAFVSGHARARVAQLEGSGGSLKLSWVVRGAGRASLILEGAGCDPQPMEVALP